MFTVIVYYYMADTVRIVTDEPQAVIAGLIMSRVSGVVIDHNLGD